MYASDGRRSGEWSLDGGRARFFNCRGNGITHIRRSSCLVAMVLILIPTPPPKKQVILEILAQINKNVK